MFCTLRYAIDRLTRARSIFSEAPRSIDRGEITTYSQAQGLEFSFRRNIMRNAGSPARSALSCMIGDVLFSRDV